MSDSQNTRPAEVPVAEPACESLPATQPDTSHIDEPDEKGLYWFTAFFLVEFIPFTITLLYPNLFSSLTGRLVENLGLSPQTSFDLNYTLLIVIQFIFRILWMLLTYKRYAHALVWKIYTLLTIFGAPFLIYSLNLFHLQTIGKFYSSVFEESFPIVITPMHLIVSLLIALVPLALFVLFILKAPKRKKPLRQAAPETDE